MLWLLQLLQNNLRWLIARTDSFPNPNHVLVPYHEKHIFLISHFAFYFFSICFIGMPRPSVHRWVMNVRIVVELFFIWGPTVVVISMNLHRWVIKHVLFKREYTLFSTKYTSMPSSVISVWYNWLKRNSMCNPFCLIAFLRKLILMFLIQLLWYQTNDSYDE